MIEFVFATIAQLVERNNGNVEVTGSTPVRGSKLFSLQSDPHLLIYI